MSSVWALRGGHGSIAVYRPDIDGLRAVAVLAVVVFHAFPEWLPGGFVGVDVFFVISGFLISSIISREVRSGTFSLLRFYEHRIRRILPSLVVVIASTLLLGWLILLPHEYADLGVHAMVAARFTSNLMLIRDGAYFDAGAQAKPLLHLWSLGVEEQFYLAWPPLLAIIALRKRTTATVIAIVMVLSFGLNVAMIRTNATWVFYHPVTRFWELLGGAATALMSDRSTARVVLNAPGSRYAQASAWLGALLIGVAVAAMNEDVAFPGWWAVAPVLGTILILLAGPAAWLNRRVLSSRLLVWIGLLSFPLYLWHWPLLSLQNIVEPVVAPVSRLHVLALSLALAYATVLLVEVPVRRRSGRAAAKVFLPALLGLMVIGQLVLRGVVHTRAHPDDAYIAPIINDWDLTPTTKVIAGIPVRIAVGSPEVVLWIGDSNAEQYFPRALELARVNTAAATSVFASNGGCPPLPEVTGADHRCPPIMSELGELVRITKARRVVIVGLWQQYFARDGKYSVGVGDRQLPLSSPEGTAAAMQLLSAKMAELRQQGVVVSVLLPMPTGLQFDPLRTLRRRWFGAPTINLQRQVSRGPLETGVLTIRHALIASAGRAGASVINPFDYLCNASSCPTLQIDGSPLYKDGSHLRASYVRNNAGLTDRLILEQ